METHMTEFEIIVVSKTYFDISKFDFSFKDITIYDIETKEFQDYIYALNPKFKGGNFSLFQQLRDEIQHLYDKKYAIVKNNPLDNYKYTELYNVFVLLLIIFPSDFQIENIIHFINEDDFIQRSHMSTFEKYYTGQYPGNFLFSHDKHVEEINEFIKLTFDRLKPNNYIGLAIENYITSFSASHLQFKYLTLCTAIETTVDGSQELVYRLKRNIAVLCAEDVGEGGIIFDNINKLYSLRSKITHGDYYDIEKVEKYLGHLLPVVSRTIIEMLIHDIENVKILNKKTTQLGFGQREKISENWKNFTLNLSTVIETNWGQVE